MLGIVAGVKRSALTKKCSASVMYYHCIENGKIGRNTKVLNVHKYSTKGRKMISGKQYLFITGDIISIEGDSVELVDDLNESQLKELELLFQLERNYLINADSKNMYDIVESEEVVNSISIILNMCDAIKYNTTQGDDTQEENYTELIDPNISTEKYAEILRKLSRRE